ncbi:MAG TPA: RteC domain-containing protein, partial [Puia sp.]|nr:RteC domain-containing protein [Puia sp.]
TDRDATYFLRSGDHGVQVIPGRIHDIDPVTATPGDHLVTMIGAYEMYQLYIRAEMEKLGGYFFLTK